MRVNLYYESLTIFTLRDSRGLLDSGPGVSGSGLPPTASALEPTDILVNLRPNVGHCPADTSSFIGRAVRNPTLEKLTDVSERPKG